MRPSQDSYHASPNDEFYVIPLEKTKARGQIS